MIKYVYMIDYPLGQKRAYQEWVRQVADTLQAPDELKRLAAYDNYFSATPQRIIEFTFDTLTEAAAYFERKEIGRVLQGELPAQSRRPSGLRKTKHSTNSLAHRTTWLRSDLRCTITISLPHRNGSLSLRLTR